MQLAAVFIYSLKVPAITRLPMKLTGFDVLRGC